MSIPCPLVQHKFHSLPSMVDQSNLEPAETFGKTDGHMMPSWTAKVSYCVAVDQ